MNHPMQCPFCGVSWYSGHLKSPTHLKNKIFYTYNQNRMYFYENRNGIVVSCNFRSSTKILEDCTDSKLKLSIKPDEMAEFEYTINNTNDTTIMVVGIDLAYLSNFIINKHQFKFGEAPYVLNADDCIADRVRVTFMAHDIGQYEMPIMFAFVVNDERIIIIREMIVYVENTNNNHVPLPSPYADLPVYAYKIIKTNLNRQVPNLFQIPQMCRKIFSRQLKPTPKWDSNLLYTCKDIKSIFDTGVTEHNYIRLFHNLLWYEEMIVRIHLKKYNMSGVPMEKMLSAEGVYRLLVPGLAEKRPSVIQGDMLYIRPSGDDSILFEGIVVKVEHDAVLIHGIEAPFATEYYGPDKLFDIRFFSSRLCYERMHVAVDNLFKSKQENRVFPQERYIIGKARAITTFFNPSIMENDEQRTAIENILARSSGTAPYIVHGPPGTGKTVTIVETILQILKRYPDARILVCTESNTAADRVAEMLIGYHEAFQNNKTFLLRANSHYRVWETMPICLRPYSNGQCFNTFRSINTNTFSEYSIVVTTLIHSAKFIGVQSITHLFIDEASQASEPSSLIPITGLLKVTGQLVLSGDTHQMGPVVISNEARSCGLGMSLMERLEKRGRFYNIDNINNNYLTLLRNNFRSHEDILDIADDLFYSGQLRAMAPFDPLSNVDILGEQLESAPVVFHGVCSQEQRNGRSPSFYNVMELEVVKQYVDALISKHQVRPEDIGIVTPYQRQVYKVKNWLDENNLSTLEVGTVEAFQGKEKRVILISTVRANPSLLSHDAMFQLGFLVDDKRFNVAITRAKAKVVIIGNPLCLIFDHKWRSVIIRSSFANTYTGYDINERIHQFDSQLLGYLNLALHHVYEHLKKRQEKKSKTLKINCSNNVFRKLFYLY